MMIKFYLPFIVTRTDFLAKKITYGTYHLKKVAMRFTTKILMCLIKPHFIIRHDRVKEVDR